MDPEEEEYVLAAMTSAISPGVELMANMLSITTTHMENIKSAKDMMDSSFQLNTEAAAALIR